MTELINIREFKRRVWGKGDMKTLHVIRALIAWLISPFVFLFMVPFFIVLAFLHDVDGPTQELIESWQKWAFMQYGSEQKP